MIERCVRDFGDERLLFATDMTMEGGVGKILDAELTEDQREKLFWRNFQAILDRRKVA
jgi:predicted TIM-barrel fold metal-dependent hydrolase